jgi:hypothetical protein
MGTKVFIGLAGAGVGFMLYALFHFVKEGRHRSRSRPAVTIAVVHHRENEDQTLSKAA